MENFALCRRLQKLELSRSKKEGERDRNAFTKGKLKWMIRWKLANLSRPRCCPLQTARPSTVPALVIEIQVLMTPGRRTDNRSSANGEAEHLPEVPSDAVGKKMVDSFDGRMFGKAVPPHES